MPPDISAGLTALAAAPPGAALSAGPLLPEPLSASLFAAFLAQSSPPSVPPAAPKAALMQALPIDPKQDWLDTQALPKSQAPPFTKALPNPKTMDTLPMLSSPAPPEAKAKASELPFPAGVVHKKDAQDQSAANGTPAPTAPGLVPALTSQIVPPPVLLFAAPVVTTAAAAALPIQAVPERTALERTALEQVAPVLPGRSDTPASALPPAAASGQAASAKLLPAQTGLPLPRTWAIGAPVQTPPEPALAAVTPTEPGQTPPEPKTVSFLAAGSTAVQPAAVKPAAVTAASVAAEAPVNPLPRVSSLASPAFQAPAAPIPAALPEVLPRLAAFTALQNAPVVTIAAATSAPPVALPPASTLKSSPAKMTGKSLPAALKPVPKDADTSTRMTAGQTAAISAKTAVPAAVPEPTPEKHTEEQKPSETADSGTSSVQIAAQTTAPVGIGKTEAQPMSAQDRAEVVRQAAEGVGAMPLPAKPGASEQMSLQLHPKDWGSLQVSVTVAPSQNAGAAKTVTAHIVAETPQVKAALQSGTGALHQALRASGLHLEHLTVSVKTPDSKAPEVKPAAQSASAGLSSGQSQPDTSGPSYGQPGAGSGTHGFGTGGSQDNRRGQPPPFLAGASEPEAEDNFLPATPFRPAAGRIDTRA